MELKSTGSLIKWLVIFILLALIILLIVQIFLNYRGGQITKSPYPTPNTSAEAAFYDQAYKDNVKKLEQQNQVAHDQTEKVGQLLTKVPYQGTNFKFIFDYNTNEYVAQINKDNKAQGEKEFTDFLKQNQVDDQSWIKNLRVEYY